MPACVVAIDDDSIELALEEHVAAISPGQSMVLFDDAIVLGGGVIERGIRAAHTTAPARSLRIVAA